MTFYDDAEFYALSLVRMAADETEDAPASGAMIGKVEELRQQHGEQGVYALVAALARFGYVASATVADGRGTSVHDLLDDFAMHKAEQHDSEE